MKNLVRILTITSMLCMLFLVPVISHAAANTPEPIAPQLQVKIPGLGDSDFKGSVIIGTAATEGTCSEGKVCIGTISVYLNSVYRFMVTAGIIFSIVIIMIGGIEYMVGSASGQLASAKKHITGAVIGLLILLTVTSVLTFVNPNISGMRSLELTILKNIPVVNPSDLDPKEPAFGASIKTEIIGADGEVMEGSSPLLDADRNKTKDIVLGNGSDNSIMHKDAIIRLQLAAYQLHNPTDKRLTPTKLELLQTYTDPRKAAREFYDKCVMANCLSEPICNPFPENEVVEGNYTDGFKLTSAFIKELDGKNIDETYQLLGQQSLMNNEPRCPFQTGFAVVAVCEGDDVFKADAVCQANLERIMQTNNFCRSLVQPWLYEFEGKQVMDSTKNCEATPGVMLIDDSSKLCDDQQVTYAFQSDHPGLCSREYGIKCSDAGARWRDNVNLRTGKCD
ncbi:hypothetical protein HQ524_03895 [Candidatus Uhrbacteria bacterium]|nr:hypothetical protein [Candidatus Uhrbacteria bacterium]